MASAENSDTFDALPPSQTVQITVQLPKPAVDSDDGHKVTIVVTPKKICATTGALHPH
jgi:hypothetical protein